jgi:transcriptional regulator with XRE-family HTH domain
MDMTHVDARPVGEYIREWRKRRRLSQLDLATDADISTRHLSFLETGRSRPSRAMIVRLAEHLGIPHREQNTLLRAAGFAPRFMERPLDAPELGSVRHTVDILLKAHMPWPALAIDRHWNLVAANDALQAFMSVADANLLEPPINVIRVSMHPDGLGRRIVNYHEWRTHIVDRLQRQHEHTADPVIADLIDEVLGFPVPTGTRSNPGLNRAIDHSIAIPMRVDLGGPILTFLSTTTVFGTPVDVTLSELAIETFLPADDVTARALAGPPSGAGLGRTPLRR